MKKVNKWTAYIKRIFFRLREQLLESLELEWILEETEQQIKEPHSHECS